MKFTEGYWLRSERVKASFATQAFEVQEIPHGRVPRKGIAVVPERDAVALHETYHLLSRKVFCPLE